SAPAPRLLPGRRDLRNHKLSREQLEERLRALPDSMENARFLNQKGEACSAEETESAKKLHREGWSHLFDWQAIHKEDA
ncbi:MAG: hypothetical protein AAGJ35_15045, partial [Myxococcota bacterium]